MPTTEKLWTPEKKIWAPFKGEFRLQVGWPDNPGNPGEIEDTGPVDNAVLNWLPWMLYSFLNPTGGGLLNRYYDGTYLYPGWADIFNDYLSAGSAAMVGANPSTTVQTSPLPPQLTNPFMPVFGSWLMGMMAIGNYTTSAPSGTVAFITQANWTTYSIVRRNDNDHSGKIFAANNVFYGPAITTETLSGIGSPNPSTSVSRTFAPQAGTVNAIAFMPLTMAPQLSQIAMPISVGLFNASVWGAQIGTESSSVSPGSFCPGTLAGSGDPMTVFSTLQRMLCSTFALLSSAVVVPGGANMTVTYTFTGNL